MGLSVEKSTIMGVMLCMLAMIEFGTRLGMVTGEVYKVGDSDGWTANSKGNYSSWASSKSFHVNDVLLFRYNATTDNVIQVSLSDFRSCNTSDPLKTFSSGNDSFTIKSIGHYYFTSNFSGHCHAGQKLDVRVPKPSPPAIDPNVAPSSPAEPNATAPSPAENAAGPTRDKIWLLSTIGVVVGGLVVVHGCYV